MTPALFIICGIGLLFSLEKVRFDQPLKPEKLKLQKVFSLSLDYLGQATILCVLFFLLKQLGAKVALSTGAVHALVFILGHWLVRKTHKSKLFFVAVFAASLWATTGSGAFSLEVCVRKLLLIVGGSLLFYFAFLSLKFRLAFCEVAKPLRGLPAFFFLAALLSLALSCLTPHLIP